MRASKSGRPRPITWVASDPVERPAWRQMVVVEPRSARALDVETWRAVTVLGLLGTRVVVRWEEGGRAGRLAWLPLDAVQ